ncbi:MAG: hypothetical protein ACKPKO_02160, partial [Candidatus Fonsibacter sp.]
HTPLDGVFVVLVAEPDTIHSMLQHICGVIVFTREFLPQPIGASGDGLLALPDGGKLAIFEGVSTTTSSMNPQVDWWRISVPWAKLKPSWINSLPV